jgi:arylsulfatase A-like enzyme
MDKKAPVDGSSLPFPQTPSASVAGRTLAESRHQWRQEPKRLPEGTPNIVIFMSDDAGFSNPDTFGGPVHTPTLSKLAQGGIAYNRFHTTAMCSPPGRAADGRNHTHVGAGQVAEFANDFDGYVGEIPRSAATVARVLSNMATTVPPLANGITPRPAMSNRWPLRPVPHWPGLSLLLRFHRGETSQYEPRLFENVNPIEPPHDPDYHLTEDLAARAKNFIRNHLTYTPDDPFFLYFAPGAVHGPHQVPKAWADKYKGKFDAGWEVLRKKPSTDRRNWAGFRTMRN